MYSKSHNIEIMINDKAVKVNKKVFEWVFFLDIKYVYKNQWKLVILSLIIFIYNIVKCHKMNVNGVGSYIDSPDWIESKKSTINPIKKMINAFIMSLHSY